MKSFEVLLKKITQGRLLQSLWKNLAFTGWKFWLSKINYTTTLPLQNLQNTSFFHQKNKTTHNQCSGAAGEGTAHPDPTTKNPIHKQLIITSGLSIVFENGSLPVNYRLNIQSVGMRKEKKKRGSWAVSRFYKTMAYVTGEA